jgi:beta-mannosidase
MLDRWRLKDFAPGQGLAAGAHAADLDDSGWTPATAPGDTHQALHAAGLLPDPLGEGGEEACRWVEDREWWWRCCFEAAAAEAGERLVLRFEGLDTFAPLYLNGELIGRSNNMFTPLEIDVTGRLSGGANILALLAPHPTTKVDDSYFDLRAGEERTLLVTDAVHDLAPEDIVVRCC